LGNGKGKRPAKLRVILRPNECGVTTGGPGTKNTSNRSMVKKEKKVVEAKCLGGGCSRRGSQARGRETMKYCTYHSKKITKGTKIGEEKRKGEPGTCPEDGEIRKRKKWDKPRGHSRMTDDQD